MKSFHRQVDDVKERAKKNIRLVLFLLSLMSPQAGMTQTVYHIGALVSGDQFVPAIEGFKKRMTELGYTEGKNVKYEIYNAKDNLEAIKRYAQKMVQEKPDLIVTSSTTATAPVVKATEGSNLCVVFLSAGNPLTFVKSYASSGNNVTGISTAYIDLTGKRLELLKQLVPGIKKVISFHNPDGGSYHESLRVTRDWAKKLRLNLVEVNVTSSVELVQWVRERLSRKLGDGIVYQPDAVILSTIPKVIPNFIKAKIPLITANTARVKEGALAAYGADYFALGEQGAMLVDKIRKGARPADLPIEQPSKLHLVINLKTARAIGLKIPKDILSLADEIIE